MSLTDYLGYLMPSFSSAANDSQPGGGDLLHDNFLTQNPNLSALGLAVAAQFVDGDDGMMWSMVKTVGDYLAFSDTLDGDPSFLSKIYLGIRASSIAGEQTHSTLASIGAGLATYFGLGMWEDGGQRQQVAARAAAPAP
jgi:hypothetical protein